MHKTVVCPLVFLVDPKECSIGTSKFLLATGTSNAGHYKLSKLSGRSLSEVLQSISGSLFPESFGKQIVNIDSTDVDGDTPLHVLLWRNDTTGALLLIEHGADVNAVGDMGETPLHVAIRQENMEVVRAMLAVGARTDIVSEFGQTPLGLAEEKGIKLC